MMLVPNAVVCQQQDIGFGRSKSKTDSYIGKIELFRLNNRNENKSNAT